MQCSENNLSGFGEATCAHDTQMVNTIRRRGDFEIKNKEIHSKVNLLGASVKFRTGHI